MSIELSEKARERLTFEDYAPQPRIDGVQHHPLKKHQALEGWFMEHLRLDGGVVEGLEPPFEVKQISLSQAVPHRINAFHIHPKTVQDELWCVIGGTLLVWLADERQDSPTLGVKRKFVLSSEAPALLRIPSGVAHGYKAGPAGATLIYAMNSQFNLDDPNEGRLPWDHFGAELWEENRG